MLSHIAYLQAFTDVNKRTARLSANIPLIKYNYVPLSFNDIQKEDYISAMLAIYELNEIQPLIDLFCFSYQISCQYYTITTQNLVYDDMRIEYRDLRRKIIREIIIKKLTKNTLATYIEKEIKNTVPCNEHEQFIKIIHEDLDLLSPSRITGLGITKNELGAWLMLKK